MNTVDELWHAAILDTKFYADLQSAMGVVLHHRPSGAPEQESEPREKRLKKMSAMYTAFFSTNPLGVSAQPHPSLQPNLSEAHLISKAPLHPSLLPQPNVIKTNSVPDETLSIDVLIFNGMELRFKPERGQVHDALCEPLKKKLTSQEQPSAYFLTDVGLRMVIP